jgi:coenzyme F420 biosynthesis associated uncharacterized protein
MSVDVQPADAVRLIDWDVAARTAITLGRPGPRVTPAEAAEIVGAVRAASAAAVDPVAEVTLLSVPSPAPALVVDRAGWIRANVGSFRTMLTPAFEQVADSRGKPPSGLVTHIGSRVTGAELGGALAFLSSRVLGQFDPFGPPDNRAAGAVVGNGQVGQGRGLDDAGGRLLLVAPNLVQVQRELEVPADDFRLWVCLHEETHRAQFASTPWLAAHLLGEIRTLTADLLGGDLFGDSDGAADKLAQMFRGLPDVLRGEGGPAQLGLLDAIQTPEQRERVAALTATMSLLEGHADVMMDAVGPQVVPSVKQIRSRFTKRRGGKGPLDQVIRRLLGLDAKIRQYADGARFVRGVVDKVGVDGFNAVWLQRENLPLPAEIADPTAWVRRVHG